MCGICGWLNKHTVDKNTLEFMTSCVVCIVLILWLVLGETFLPKAQETALMGRDYESLFDLTGIFPL